MAKIWEKHKGYLPMLKYVILSTRSCFRSIKIEGTERIPRDGAVILAPNHCAALMDPLLVLVLFGGKPVVFGARSDIFSNPKAARILRWLRILPIARERNGLSEVAKNLDTFKEIIDCLDNQVPFCLYAEGTHNPEREMLPVKKGIFRIAKMAQEQLGVPVRIVPVGVNYEDFFRGQGRIIIRIGEPLEIGEEFARREGLAEAEIYRELTTQLRDSDMALIGPEQTRRHDLRALRALGALLSLPLFALFAVGSLPIWLPYLIIMHGMEDKAWSHTVRFAMHFIFPVFWIFHIPFERLLNFYRHLFEDLRA
ncbi:MAG: 1-acyl-sn-glycerol-3-phosphate acyltransferase [Bacteroidales bacterium]|nr:1-acyl-sn-glycerol-3-phosphate acyltransferase [Bacteroidales bacterium]